MSSNLYNYGMSNIYKTTSSDTRSGPSSFNAKIRTTSVANKNNFATNGASIARIDSKSKFESGYREEKTPKYVDPSPLLREEKNLRYGESRLENSYKDEKTVKFSYYTEPKRDSRMEPRSTKGLVGFRNLGNTCFMNSILQCLVRLPPFRDAMLNIEKKDICRSSKLNGNLALAFKALVQEIRNSNNFSAIAPYDVKTQIGHHSRQFRGYDQQDSAEFFRCILEGLNIDLNRIHVKPEYQEMTGNTNENSKNIASRWWNYSLSRDDSLVTDFFQGQQISVITCRECGYGSVSCDSFLCLNLPSPESYLRATTLEQCLNLYFKESVLSSYRCEKCKRKDGCKQKISISKFPRILVLQIKRFHVDGFRKERLNTDISYTEELNMNGYKDFDNGDAPVYSLYGISHHIGSLYSGHYISDCKDEGRWYCFDDSRVSSIDTPCRSSTAYLLFYVAVG